MNFLKTKPRQQPTNRFQDYLQNQPVFNWFSRYEAKPDAPSKEKSLAYEHNWMSNRKQS